MKKDHRGADTVGSAGNVTLLSRRDLLKSAVVVGAATLGVRYSVLARGGSTILVCSTADAEAKINVLNRALQQEYTAIRVYQLAEESGLLKDGLYDGVNLYMFQHLNEHVETLKNAVADLGGKALAAPPKVKPGDVIAGVTAGADLATLLRQLLAAEVQLADLYGQAVKDMDDGKLRAALEAIKEDERIHQRFYRYVLSSK